MIIESKNSLSGAVHPINKLNKLIPYTKAGVFRSHIELDKPIKILLTLTWQKFRKASFYFFVFYSF
jgi:hypothetical protein